MTAELTSVHMASPGLQFSQVKKRQRALAVP